MTKMDIEGLKIAYKALNPEDKRELLKRLNYELETLMFRLEEKKRIIQALQNS